MHVDLELRLLYKDQKRAVNPGLVASLNTFKEALLLCKALSLLDDSVIAERMGITLTDFIKIFSGDGYFPMEKLIDYMRICENIIPVLWLSLKCGYNLHPLEQELEQESRLLEEEIEKKRQEIEVFMEEILGGLMKRLSADKSKGAKEISELIEELRKELGKS
jgi:hypothetical protein